MALIGRKPPRRRPPGTTGDADDDRLLQMIWARSPDPAAPREWIHYLYCETPEGAAVMESAAVAAGWTVRRVSEGEGIVATRSDLPVTASTVIRQRAFFEGLALGAPGGEYDGWEAAI